jgi:UDP-N-acetylglucosamine:LPS N-acetylglucosamine transferase
VLFRSNEKTIVLRGLPEEKVTIDISPNVEVYNHLSASMLNEVICQSEFLVCRSGYSTVMDVARLGKKSVMIPTPGQTEQEYLAEYLSNKKISMKINQNQFSLGGTLEAAKKFPFIKYKEENNHFLKNAINNLFTK